MSDRLLIFYQYLLILTGKIPEINSGCEPCFMQDCCLELSKNPNYSGSHASPPQIR